MVDVSSKGMALLYHADKNCPKQDQFITTNFGVPYFDADDSFDTVLATSALEHFRDLEGAVAEIARITKRGGSLLFLSPTENVFYRFGRWLFRYKKPEDHYHSAKDIEGILEKYYTAEVRRNFPCNFLPFLSIYRLGRFRMNGIMREEGSKT